MSLQSSVNEKVSPVTRSETIKECWAALLEQATREVFSMMLGYELESEPGGPSSALNRDLIDPIPGRQPLIEVLFRRDAESSPNGNAEVTAVVGLAGELCGVLNFACGTAAARMMAARLLGVDEADAGDQQWDAIGEMCNMVAGNFKSKLPGGDRCMLSVPTIVVGSNYRLRTVSGRHKVEYRFRVATAPIRITLEVEMLGHHPGAEHNEPLPLPHAVEHLRE